MSNKENEGSFYLTKPSLDVIQVYINKILKLLCDAYHDLVLSNRVEKDSLEDEINALWFEYVQIHWKSDLSLPFIPAHQEPIRYETKERIILNKIDIGFKYR